MRKAIYFDMDGTIVNLYGQKNWLARLRKYDATPYLEAEPLVNPQLLADILLQLKRKGYVIGIISWLSKESTPAYDKAVRVAKVDWLENHFDPGFFDKIHIVKFGTPKRKVTTIRDSVLFDDNEEVRQRWGEKAYNEKAILPVLRQLVAE